MSSFAGIEFKVVAVDEYKWLAPSRSQDAPRVWSGTIQLDSLEDLNSLEDWFCTIDSRRGLRSKTWVHIIKAGDGYNTLDIPFGFTRRRTIAQAILTRIEPQADGWRDGRYFADVEFTLP